MAVADVKTGKCLWCEMPETEIFADGLCAMCTETRPPPRVTPEMLEAWVNYEPPAGFEVERDIGYNDVVAMIRQAFMNGFARGIEAFGQDAKRLDGEATKARPEGRAQPPANTGEILMSELSEAMIEAGVKALNTSDMVMRDSRSACERAQVERIYLAMSRAALPSMSEVLVERVARALWSVTAPKKLSWAATPQTSRACFREYARAAISVVLGG